MAESDPAQLLKTYLDAGQNLMGQFASGALPGEMPDSAVGFQNSASDFMAEAARFAKLQEDYVQQISDYWSGLFGASPKVEQAPHDRRFAADAWKEVPGFDALKG